MGYDLETCEWGDFIPESGVDGPWSGPAYHLGYRARFNSSAWPRLLHLAETYGWKPAGTLLGRKKEWCGTYLGNNYQTVTAEDAAGLADALERALPDLAENEVEGKIVTLARREIPAGLNEQMETDFGSSGGEFVGPNLDMHPFEYFGGRMRPRVEEFIKLCRRGAFHIA